MKFVTSLFSFLIIVSALSASCTADHDASSNEEFFLPAGLFDDQCSSEESEGDENGADPTQKFSKFNTTMHKVIGMTQDEWESLRNNCEESYTFVDATSLVGDLLMYLTPEEINTLKKHLREFDNSFVKWCQGFVCLIDLMSKQAKYHHNLRCIRTYGKTLSSEPSEPYKMLLLCIQNIDSKVQELNEEVIQSLKSPLPHCHFFHTPDHKHATCTKLCSDGAERIMADIRIDIQPFIDWSTQHPFPYSSMQDTLVQSYTHMLLHIRKLTLNQQRLKQTMRLPNYWGKIAQRVNELSMRQRQLIAQLINHVRATLLLARYRFVDDIVGTIEADEEQFEQSFMQSQSYRSERLS